MKTPLDKNPLFGINKARVQRDILKPLIRDTYHVDSRGRIRKVEDTKELFVRNDTLGAYHRPSWFFFADSYLFIP